VGSARVSRAGFGVAPKQSFRCVPAEVNRTEPTKKFAIAKTRSPITRDVCAPQTRSFDGYAFGEVAWFIDVASQLDG